MEALDADFTQQIDQLPGARRERRMFGLESHRNSFQPLGQGSIANLCLGAGRLIDQDQDASMEKKKREGYF